MSLHVTTNVLYACVSSDGFGVFYHVLKVLEDRLEDGFDQFCHQNPLMGQHMTIGVRTKGTSHPSLVYDGRFIYICVYIYVYPVLSHVVTLVHKSGKPLHHDHSNANFNMPHLHTVEVLTGQTLNLPP